MAPDIDDTSLNNVIRFPVERRALDWKPNTSDEFQTQTECTELVHVFVKTPGLCKCGEHEWDFDPSKPA